MNIIDLTGQRFGRLTVLRQENGRKRGAVLWTCKCDCGNVISAPSGNLRAGRKRSCGCLVSETASKTAKTGSNRRTHGMKGTKIYHVWDSIKYRCTNDHYPRWKDYGGRGITVCDEWLHDFQAFFDHISKLPHYGERGYSIDRIDNNGNYEPGNIRWATRTEQNRNRRNVKRRNENGISDNLAKQ